MALNSVVSAAQHLVDAMTAERFNPQRDLVVHSAAEAARVELLITLAEYAGETWEPDLALHLLWAADAANGMNVDANDRILEWYVPGPVEVALRARLERAAVQMIEHFRTEETYDDSATRSGIADFQEICRRITRRREIEASEASRAAGDEGRAS